MSPPRPSGPSSSETICGGPWPSRAPTSGRLDTPALCGRPQEDERDEADEEGTGVVEGWRVGATAAAAAPCAAAFGQVAAAALKWFGFMSERRCVRRMRSRGRSRKKRLGDGVGPPWPSCMAGTRRNKGSERSERGGGEGGGGGGNGTWGTWGVRAHTQLFLPGSQS